MSLTKHLFLFTISPVQSFIAQARKTQDLYAGSLILAELTKAAAQEAQTQGLKLVFPQEIHTGNSFPNRFIGTLEGDFTNQELQTKGQSIEDKVQETFANFANDALNKVQLGAPQGFWQQIEAHLDINWLFLPIETSYKSAYEQIEPYMASLKNLRLIHNRNPEDAGRKCSLDGERNALFFGQGTNPNYVSENEAVIVSQGAWLYPNEGLSAVSLVKRSWGETFPSTAAVALSQQISELSPQNEKLLACYEKLFSSNYPQACLELVEKGYFQNININKTENWRTEFDEQLLFEENLTPKNIPNATQLSIAKQIQQTLKPHLKQNHYALIAFDGDKMGALLSGEYLKDKTTDLAEFQGELSSLLMKFSQWIYNNLDKKQVDVIYAGGDDFLGFVNLHHLFEVVKTLRIEFEKQVNQKLQEQYPLEKKGELYDFTFSMGIVIAHYKTPLSIVLQTARNMEKLAKSKEGGNRNAFAIAALKHSGENHQAYFKWDLDKKLLNEPDKGELLPTWNALKNLIDHFENDCSETFVRNLDRELYLLQDGEGNIANKEEVMKDKEKKEPDQTFFMLETELLRLAKKSLQEGKKGKATKLRDTVWTFFKPEKQTTHTNVAVKNGTEATKIALFLKRQIKKQKNGTTN